MGYMYVLRQSLMKRVAASSMLAPGVSVAEAVKEWHCNADVPVVFGNTIAALGRQDWR